MSNNIKVFSDSCAIELGSGKNEDYLIINVKTFSPIDYIAYDPTNECWISVKPIPAPAVLFLSSYVLQWALGGIGSVEDFARQTRKDIEYRHREMSYEEFFA
ncbi:hypothetical protein [Paenibacillus sp. FSL H3-0333]|uniref:hypothetical protein n=1 Tax=Paenibacillus sp. FSL H3-0333 TaxID=2921373 RepID=UPI0030F71BBE